MGALVRFIVTSDAALLQSTASPEIIRRSDCRCYRHGHRRCDALITRRVPLLYFNVELRVEHMGFEASRYIAFTTEHRGQLILFSAPSQLMFAAAIGVLCTHILAHASLCS